MAVIPAYTRITATQKHNGYEKTIIYYFSLHPCYIRKL